MLNSMIAPFFGVGNETEEGEDYGVLPSELFPSMMPAPLADVAERFFDEHLTDTGRIYARGMGIKLD